MKYDPTKLKVNTSYLKPRISPSNETKKVLKLAQQVKLTQEQNKYIVENNFSYSDLSKVLAKKLNVI